MSSPACALLPAAVLLFFGVLQALGATPDPQDDPDYKLFQLQIQSQKQQVEYKLNSSRDIFVSNTKTFNLPEFDAINSTLFGCFEAVKTVYPYADQDCLTSVQQDVQQTISDSQNELAACSNLTHSWELVGQLIERAEEAVQYLDDVVNKTLEAGLACVVRYPYNPSFKNKCFSFARGIYKSQWANATSLVQEAYYVISGGNLLLDVELSSCQKAENTSYTKKCNDVVSEVVINCVPPTPTTTTTTPITAPITTSNPAPTATDTPTPTPTPPPAL